MNTEHTSKQRISLNSCSIGQLQGLVRSLNGQKFRADQLYRWLYHEKVTSINEMTNLSKDFRQALEEIAEITVIKEIARTKSKIDGTIKLLFELDDGERIESVILPDRDRVTACISTQVGCKMGCTFCATATIGFKRNLSAAEILEQIRQVEQIVYEEGFNEDASRLTNIVFMGMGEPLDNFDNLLKALAILTDENAYSYSHRRVTVSTVGLIPAIKMLFESDISVKLAISVNAPNQDIRQNIMPVSKKYPLQELFETLKMSPLKKRERITLEYVLLSSVNDRPEHARQLLKLIGALPVKINLIRYNGGAKTDMRPPDEKNVLAFQKILTDNGLSAFIRKSLGADILGACGQLAARYGNGDMNEF